MNVDEVYRIIKFIVNKAQQGYVTPENFNLSINTAQKQYQSWLLGTLQQYTPGRPIARVELGQNRTVRTRLAPVIYGYVLSINSAGTSPYPTDYLQTDAMWSIYGTYGQQGIYGIYGVRRIRYAEQQALDSYYNSVIDPISTSPIYLLEDVGFQFFPTDLYQAKLHYVKDCPQIVWAYTLDVNNRPVFNSSTSINPVWDDAACLDIIGRCLRIIGVNLQAGEVSKYAEELKLNGE